MWRKTIPLLLLAGLATATTGEATLITNPLVIESFEDGNISEYTQVSALSANWAVTNAAAHDGNFGLATAAPTGTISDWIYRNDAAVALAQGAMVSSWVNSSNLDGRAYFGFGSSNLGTYSMVLAPNTSELILQRNSGFGFLNIGATPFGWTANKWYLFEVDWGVGGNIVGRLYDSDGTTLLSSVNALDNTFVSGGIAFRGFSGTKQFDTVTTQGQSAVPEPATLTLVGIGLAGAGAMRRRKRKA